MKIKVACYDIDHSEDEDDARDDVRKAGGKILKEVRRPEDEAIYFLVEVPDREVFEPKLERCELL